MVQEKLPARLAARIHLSIVDGTFPPGSKLPHQRELAEQFGVSVSVLRESLALLVSAGLVWSKSGQGTFVAEGADAPLRFPTWVEAPRNASELGEALEAREILERSLVRLACVRATADDIERLRRRIEDMYAAVSTPARFPDADLAFHLAIADAARNRPLTGALNGLRRLLEVELRRRAADFDAAGALTAAVDLHARLVDAIEARDEASALTVLDDVLRPKAPKRRRRRSSPPVG
jgi:GntR family transcriptional regulator, transcriptional repressor for pyruvate dehydrogenase complex